MHVFKEEEKDSLEMIARIYRKRWSVLITTMLFGAAALCISLFVLTEKFQSESIIYPTPSNSEEVILENPTFGFEGHANQLLQVLQSNTLRKRLIDEFSLVSYYAIDTNLKDWYTRLGRKMDKDIRFERTPYYSIKIVAETADPELSSNIVNYIADELNVILQEIFQTNIEDTYNAYREEYLEKEAYVEELLDSLIAAKEYNTDQALSHVDIQTRQTYMEIQGLRNDIQELKSSHEIYAYDEQVALLSNQLANASARYNHTKGQYDELKKVLGQNDTTLLKIKGEMLGARKNADTSRYQLEQLRSVKNEYSELNLLLERALIRYADLKNRRQELENAYEPTINSASLTQLQSELDFAQEQMQILKSRYEKARQKMENKIPSIYVVSRGIPNYDNSSPSVVKNTLVGLVLGLVFSTGWTLLSTRWKTIRQKLEHYS